MMHLLLFLFFLIVGLSSTVDEACFMMAPTDSGTDCFYEGKIIKDKQGYRSSEKCIDCSCTKGSLHCCSIGMRITSTPANCKVVPDGPCSQKAVLIVDENKTCPGEIAMVGR